VSVAGEHSGSVDGGVIGVIGVRGEGGGEGEGECCESVQLRVMSVRFPSMDPSNAGVSVWSVPTRAPTV
jgi:hypothetical protein